MFAVRDERCGALNEKDQGNVGTIRWPVHLLLSWPAHCKYKDKRTKGQKDKSLLLNLSL